MIGKTVSHYRILEKLGEGGMGVVYKAEDTKLGRTVALKFLPPELTRDPEAKERFIQEAKAASALDHNNICNIHEIGETAEEQIFIAMACYEGETLRDRIKRGPLEIDEAVRIASQVAEGLAKAHARGIVHRDIKPANIMVTDDGVVKILDFGLAKLSGQIRLTKTSSTVGTIAYMSPEQIGGRDVDGRTDIWSLGVVLYEMVTGRLPFTGEYEPALMYSILNDRPKLMSSFRDGVPRELEQVAKKALVKAPDGRYQNVAELLTSLRSLGEPQRGRARTSGARRAKERKRSVAVLPFRSLSESKEDEYFSDGTTEDIITQLSKIGELRVISRTSVMRYKHSEKSIPEIGRELGVAKILEGSVRRAGGRVRIVAQLLDVRTDEHIWAETYDRVAEDVFAIQSDVAEKIAGALEAKLSPAEKDRIERKPTESMDAYNHYLRARFYWNKRHGDDLKRAIEHFSRAIDLDPGYALAHAGLASTYILLPEYVGLPPKEHTPKGEAAARRAIELDPSLAEPHAALGWIKMAYEWDWAGAENELRRAIELNPSFPTAHQWYSLMLAYLGRFEEAEAECTKAQELDPLSLIISSASGDVPYYAREYDKAAERYESALELDVNFAPARWMLGRTYAQQGKLDEAIVELERVKAIVGSVPYVLMDLGYAYARAARTNDAEGVLEELLRLSGQGYSVSYGIALVYWGLGDRVQALEWLERAHEERSRHLVEIMQDGVWDGLRSHPRFLALQESVGLAK